MSTAWFHCFSGVAGDMALGALVDAGADFDQVCSMLDLLPIGGWRAEAETVQRGGIAATKIHVQHRDTSVVRTAAHIQGLIAEARLPDRVQSRALAVFGTLALAEGRLHQRPPDQVHFHEVGGIDAIVDVVGTCAALDLLDVDDVTCSPVAVGLGMVRAAHGVIPNPAPAVVELLRGVPTKGIDVAVELTTPTGAALMAGTASGFGALPPMRITASGFGAGTRDFEDRPNLTQVVLGEPAAISTNDGQPVVLLEANVDDATGEVLAHALARLLDAGAHDAWITPILMKKGRPAHTVHALCDTALVTQITGVLAAETGTLGVRGSRLERWPSARREGRVLIDDLSIRVKVSAGRIKAEFDDAARAAERTGRPVRDVLNEAETTWRREHPAEPLDTESTAGTGPPRSDGPDAGRGRVERGGLDLGRGTGHPSRRNPEEETASSRTDDEGPGGSVTAIRSRSTGRPDPTPPTADDPDDAPTP